MFTGLVEETGKVKSVEEAGEGKRIILEAGKVFTDASNGDSISVSGTCLTVEETDGKTAKFFLAEETLDRTWFSGIEENDLLNLERSLKPDDRMGGHFVQGHVEHTAEIKTIEELEEGWNFTFSMPEKLKPYTVEKGFIAVEGISLTVTSVSDTGFSVTIIPETWEKTNFSSKHEGSPVNVEADVLAKYAENASKYDF